MKRTCIKNGKEMKNKEKRKVEVMGLFSSISAWNAARAEKHRVKMEERGFCPDCNGRGYSPFVPTEYHFSDIYDCPGCNGSGKYEDWANMNGTQM
ncbi:methionine aminopeptidase [Bacillus massiliglaciei]|uniref:methionine aminopeptidase n=1 Tax=Bacillus massiliglaciei TaxID=1816693 RepID=UPI001F3ACFF8|nr:methionine aminopeptidase [Bacillus massiliglaciei]